MNVYLAGGMRSEWQDKVTASLHFSNVYADFFDPSKVRKVQAFEQISKESRSYTTRDLFKLRNCDIVFVFIEKDNPACIGLAAEVGFARALNKVIITVFESGREVIPDRYFDMIKEMSDAVTDTLEDGIKYLKFYISN